MNALWIILGIIGAVILAALIYLACVGMKCIGFLAEYLDKRNK